MARGEYPSVSAIPLIFLFSSEALIESGDFRPTDACLIAWGFGGTAQNGLGKWSARLPTVTAFTLQAFNADAASPNRCWQ